MKRFLFSLLVIGLTTACGGISNQHIGNPGKESQPLACAARAPGDICLAWDPVNDPRVAGYKIYIGPAPGIYTVNWPVGNVTTTLVTNLQPGQVYYMAVTAHDGATLESDYSNVLGVTIPTGGAIPMSERVLGELPIRAGNLPQKVYLGPDNVYKGRGNRLGWRSL